MTKDKDQEQEQAQVITDENQEADLAALQFEAEGEDANQQLITNKEHQESQSRAKAETSAIIAPFVKILCTILEKRLPPEIETAERYMLTEVYTDCALHYFPDGIPMSPPVVAILITATVFGSRYAMLPGKQKQVPDGQSKKDEKAGIHETMKEAGQ